MSVDWAEFRQQCVIWAYRHGWGSIAEDLAQEACERVFRNGYETTGPRLADVVIRCLGIDWYYRQQTRQKYTTELFEEYPHESTVNVQKQVEEWDQIDRIFSLMSSDERRLMDKYLFSSEKKTACEKVRMHKLRKKLAMV